LTILGFHNVKLALLMAHFLFTARDAFPPQPVGMALVDTARTVDLIGPRILPQLEYVFGNSSYVSLWAVSGRLLNG
jgi:hypothetical protein